MLFDDDDQLEVRHVISLAHHNISIYSGGDTTPEGELFIKRNALCLARKTDGPELAPDSQISKPFYLFSENCSEKEDFYFALLKNQEQTFSFDSKAPSPKFFEVKNIISLVQKLHSNEEHTHTRWLNAMIGRVFLGLYKTRDLESLICEKITKKISRVKRPSFLTNITIQRINTGEAAPYFTNLKLKDLTVEGECVVEADVKYTGNFRIEVAATAKIDLGARFKVREVNLVLALVLKKIEGHVLFKIKPPPSNRVWFSFQTMPKMDMAIEPIVSSRQITYTVILRQIENRIKEVFAETLVQPFWDDIPFFKTEHKNWRGGIFEGDDAVEPSEDLDHAVAEDGDIDALDRLEENNGAHEPRPIEKSFSLPVIENHPAPAGLFGRKLGRAGTSSAASASSTSVDAKGASPRLARSPSIMSNTPEPIVGTDNAHADLFKPSSSPPDHATNYMASLHSRGQDDSLASTPLSSPTKPSSAAQSSDHSSSSSTQDGKDGDREEGVDSTHVAPGRRNTASSTESASHEGSGDSQSDTASTFKGHAGSLGRNFFLRRENSNASTATGSTHSDSSQKRNTLAAVTSAAAQARQWGWNAIQRQKEMRKNGEAGGQVDLSQPMGRGQPLPPPGTPLPRPTNGTTKIAPVPAPKRKPVAAAAAAAAAWEGSTSDVTEPQRDRRPSLPQRRRRGESYKLEDDAEQNVLVVAAPNDSQPATPADEKDEPEYATPWVEDADAEEEATDGDTLVLPPPTAGSDITEKPSPEASLAADEAPREHRDEEQLKADDPIVAMPAATTPEEDDDDDYSGWMDNDLDAAPDSPPPASVPQEVKS